MDDTTTGLPNEEPTQTGVQDSGQPNTEAATQPAPDRVTELEAKLQQLEAQRSQLEQSARYHQSRADQTLNQLKAVTGVTPQTDPIVDKASAYAKQVGLAPEDVKSVLTILQGEMSPYMEALKQQQVTLQASAQVSNALQAAYSQIPQLFADPANAKAAQDALQEAAFRNPEYVTPEYAIAIAKQQWADAHWSQQMSGQPQRVAPAPAVPQYSGNIPSFMGPPGGFTPVAPTTQKAINPLSAQFDKEIAARYGNK